VHGLADTSGDERAELLPRGYRVCGWEVTEPIGAGGWATVYAGRAVDAARAGRTGQVPAPIDPASQVPDDVALKFLPTAGLAPLQARKVAESARREVELGRRAGHPRLIRLLDLIVLTDPDRPWLDGAIVLVMERAEHSLRTVFDAGVSEAEVARLFAAICEGLAHLHRSGWVHGDLKPENILLMADGSLKLSDFGLATELTGTTGTHGYAPPMGTFDYLPPERWKAPLGERGVQVRPSADIWALGIMIHEVFTRGVSPFPGGTPGSRGAAVQEYADGRAPLRIDGAVPPFWRQLATDCLAPVHAARSAHTAESLLARIISRESVPSVRRRRATRAALLAVGVCGAAAALWSSADPGGAPVDGEPAGRIRVFNAETQCRDRLGRDPQCSLGLAIDPLKPYTTDNVVPTRVWHGDALDVDCRLSQGMPIIDESDASSTGWYQVRLPKGGTHSKAWLPAVRTRGHPEVPACPRPVPEQ